MSEAKIINLHETKTIFDLKSYSSGVHSQIISVYGNSFVSSVFVLSIDPDTSVQVNYFDTTLGYAYSERYDIGSHDVLDNSYNGKTQRELFCLIHNKVVCEIVVSGGNAILGVSATASSAFDDKSMDQVIAMARSSGFAENELFDKLVCREVANNHKILEYSNVDICQFQIVAKKDSTGFSLEKRVCEFFMLQENADFLLQENGDKIKINGLIPL